MGALKEHIKLYIVQHLACFDTPSEVAAAVEEEFGVKIDRSHVGNYDPTTHKGRELGKKLREYFFKTREEFLTDFTKIPLANKSVRVRELSKLYRKAVASKNTILAKELLEQIAKEEGGVYSRYQPEGSGVHPLIAWINSLEVSTLPIAYDVEGKVIDHELEPQEGHTAASLSGKKSFPGRD